MDCVNHSGVNATAYCQSCGKALCQACVRKGPGGQIFCEPCWRSWQSAQRPYVPPPVGGPSPGLAALLGFIPGVGAMYNGQFVKGMVHVAIFAVLVSAAHVFGVFGLFVAGWIFYQVFEAYHTARARRDGDPLPDPLGLNELSNSISRGRAAAAGPATARGTGSGNRPGRNRAPTRRRSGGVPDAVSGSVSGSVSSSISGLRTRRPYTPPGYAGTRRFRRFRPFRRCLRRIGGAGSRSAP